MHVMSRSVLLAKKVGWEKGKIGWAMNGIAGFL
jgi:hypothetical protein